MANSGRFFINVVRLRDGWEPETASDAVVPSHSILMRVGFDSCQAAEDYRRRWNSAELLRRLGFWAIPSEPKRSLDRSGRMFLRYGNRSSRQVAS